MADTIRTRADILALLADNSSQEISAQDLRDSILSAMASVGGVYVVDGTTAQTGITSTFTKLTAFDSDFSSDNITADHTDDSVTVSVDGIYSARLQISFAGSSNETFDFALSVNGVESAVRFRRKLGGGGDVGSGSCHGPLTLSAGDVVTVEVKSGGTASLTVAHAQLVLERKT